MITLYSNDCAVCKMVKAKLDSENRRYDLIKVSPDTVSTLKAEGFRSMPVMKKGDMAWEGHDCLVAIEEGEVS